MTLFLIWANVQEVQTHKRDRNCGAPPAHRLVLLQTSMDESILDLSTCPKGCEAQTTPKFWRASGTHTRSASQPRWMTLTLSWLRVRWITFHKELKNSRASSAHTCATSNKKWITRTLITVHVEHVAKHERHINFSAPTARRATQQMTLSLI